MANDDASLPIAQQLFLLEAWTNDPARRAKAGVPAAFDCETKTAIALGQLRQALADGVPVGIDTSCLAANFSRRCTLSIHKPNLGLRLASGRLTTTQPIAGFRFNHPEPAPAPAA